MYTPVACDPITPSHTQTEDTVNREGSPRGKQHHRFCLTGVHPHSATTMETKMPTGPPSPTPSSALMAPRESPQGEQATPSLRGSISDSPSTAIDRHKGKRRLDKARRRASRGRLLTRDPNKKPRAASAQRTTSRRRKRQERAEGLKCAYDSDTPPVFAQFH